jgi:CBS domain-containing protein
MNVETRTEEIMEREVTTLAPDECLDLAEDVMALGRIRHLPVLQDGRVVGIVSHRDLLAAGLSRARDFDGKQRRTFLEAVEVREVMTRDVATLPPGATLEAAAALMLVRKISCIPIVHNETLVGIVTDTDLLRTAFLGEADEGEDVATRKEPEMSPVSHRYEEELQELRKLRDELRVQIHLGKAEAKDLWDQLEHRFIELEAKAKQIAQRMEHPIDGIGEATRLLAHEIREGYRTLRDLL